MRPNGVGWRSRAEYLVFPPCFHRTSLQWLQQLQWLQWLQWRWCTVIAPDKSPTRSRGVARCFWSRRSTHGCLHFFSEPKATRLRLPTHARMLVVFLSCRTFVQGNRRYRHLEPVCIFVALGSVQSVTLRGTCFCMKRVIFFVASVLL